MTLEEQLEAGNRLLERAASCRTRLVQIRNATDQAVRNVQAEGYRCLEPGVGYYLQTTAHAETLLKLVSARSGNVAVWLDDHVGGAGLRAFLAAARDAEGRCLAWTETA